MQIFKSGLSFVTCARAMQVASVNKHEETIDLTINFPDQTSWNVSIPANASVGELKDTIGMGHIGLMVGDLRLQDNEYLNSLGMEDSANLRVRDESPEDIAADIAASTQLLHVVNEVKLIDMLNGESTSWKEFLKSPQAFGECRHTLDSNVPPTQRLNLIVMQLPQLLARTTGVTFDIEGVENLIGRFLSLGNYSFISLIMFYFHSKPEKT